MIKNGTAPKIKQDESQATYEPLCTDALTVIDWSRPAQQVYNLIRGANPTPGASTTFKGEKLKIFDSSLLQTQHQALTGEIVSINDEGFIVAGSGGGILVKRVQPAGGGKVKSTEFVTASGLKVGDRLGA